MSAIWHTTTAMARLGLSAILVASCGSASFRTRDEVLNAAAVPPQLLSEYQLFADRCSACHSLARPLNSGIADDMRWHRVVERMRREPGSAVSEIDANSILRFLHWYSRRSLETAKRDVEQ